MGGQIIDSTLVSAPKQRNTQDEKAAIKAGNIPEDWKDKPARLRQKDREARWTVKFAKRGPQEDGKPQIDIAIPVLGYKSHISIDRKHGIIRRQHTSDAAAHHGERLRKGLIDPANAASDVWADTAYRSAANEDYLDRIGKTSRIHRKKLKGQTDARSYALGQCAKLKLRAHVGHVFAE